MLVIFLVLGVKSVRLLGVSRVLHWLVYFSYLFVDNLSEKRKKRKRISYTFRTKRARYFH